jgi:hypothetical protein
MERKAAGTRREKIGQSGYRNNRVIEGRYVESLTASSKEVVDRGRPRLRFYALRNLTGKTIPATARSKIL